MSEAKLVELTFPLRFVDDWLDSGGPYQTEQDERDPLRTVEIVLRRARTITLRLGPSALRDLQCRAEVYDIEQLDAHYRGLQASARAVLRIIAAFEAENPK